MDRIAKTVICIYQIKFLTNQKIYIGRASDFVNRKKNHLRNLRSGIHSNKKLQADFNLYGEKNIRFDLLEVLNHPDELFEAEKYWVNRLNPEYNAAPIQDCKHRKKELGQVSSEERMWFMDAIREFTNLLISTKD